MDKCVIGFFLLAWLKSKLNSEKDTQSHRDREFDIKVIMISIIHMT